MPHHQPDALMQYMGAFASLIRPKPHQLYPLWDVKCLKEVEETELRGTLLPLEVHSHHLLPSIDTYVAMDAMVE